jgi:hypothetical protein
MRRRGKHALPRARARIMPACGRGLPPCSRACEGQPWGWAAIVALTTISLANSIPDAWRSSASMACRSKPRRPQCDPDLDARYKDMLRIAILPFVHPRPRSNRCTCAPTRSSLRRAMPRPRIAVRSNSPKAADLCGWSREQQSDAHRTRGLRWGLAASVEREIAERQKAKSMEGSGAREAYPEPGR